MNSKIKLSVIILTHNSLDKIKATLQSVNFADEILITYDFLPENSNQKIKSPDSLKNFQNKIKIYYKKLNGNFSSQRNFALIKASSPWVLFVDSDEVVSADLKQEILEKINLENDTVGYYIKRKDYFLGKWLNFGETAFVKFIRLAKKNEAIWQGRVHEIWQLNGKTQALNNPLLHYSHQDIKSFLAKINSYTDIVAQHWIEQGRTSNFFQIVFYPTGKFIFNYLFKFGFFDGTQGFIIAAFMSFHSFLVRAKVFLAQHQ